MSRFIIFVDMWKGAIAAVSISLPIALLFAVLFRLPIPMSGLIGPFGDYSVLDMGILGTAQSVFVAWLFYGVLGGFIVLSVAGTVAGWMISYKHAQMKTSAGKNAHIALWGVVISVVAVFVLSTLDYLIGPW